MPRRLTDDERAAQQRAIADCIRRAMETFDVDTHCKFAALMVADAERPLDGKSPSWAIILAIVVRDPRLNDALRQVLAGHVSEREARREN